MRKSYFFIALLAAGIVFMSAGKPASVTEAKAGEATYITATDN